MSFPGPNQNKGRVGPSSGDLATMRSVYQEEQKIAAASSYDDKRPEGVRTDNTSALPLAELGKAGFTALDLTHSLIGGTAPAKPSGNKRPESGPVDRTLVLSQPRLDRASLSVPDLRQPIQHAKPFINAVGDKRPGTGLADSVLTLKPASLNKARFYLFDVHHPRVNRSLFLSDRRFSTITVVPM